MLSANRLTVAAAPARRGSIRLVSNRPLSVKVSALRGGRQQKDLQKNAKSAARTITKKGQENLRKLSEGADLSKPAEYGNSSIYALNAAIVAAAAAICSYAPAWAATIGFQPSHLAESGGFLIVPLFRLWALGLTADALINWVQSDAAKLGDLGDTIHRRLNAGLSTFSIAQIALLTLGLTPAASAYLGASGTDVLSFSGYLALGGGVALQLYVAATNYARVSPTGYNAIADIRTWVRDASNTFSGINGTISGAYAALAAAFVGAGVGYLLLPGPTIKAVFGAAAGESPESLLLWQLIGAGVAMLVGPVAYSLKEAAADNNLSNPRNKLLNIILSGAGLGHVLLLQPVLGTQYSGPLTPILVGTWGLAAALSSFNLLQRPKA